MPEKGLLFIGVRWKEKLDDLTKTNVNANAKGDALEGADKLTESIKNKWSGFITSTETKGAKVGIPPSGVMVTTKTIFFRCQIL